jgi:hypothetical protein
MDHSAALTNFRCSLTAEAPQPTSAPALRGLWHALRGEWDLAHDAIQPDTRDCAWVHAALHREEGDLPNADYWYGLARRPRGAGTSRDEYFAIAAALLAVASSPLRG